MARPPSGCSAFLREVGAAARPPRRRSCVGWCLAREGDPCLDGRARKTPDHPPLRPLVCNPPPAWRISWGEGALHQEGHSHERQAHRLRLLGAPRRVRRGPDRRRAGQVHEPARRLEDLPLAARHPDPAVLADDVHAPRRPGGDRRRASDLIVAGLDKFTNLLVDWKIYLSPLAIRILPFSPTTFMHLVGLVEIVVGLPI